MSYGLNVYAFEALGASGLIDAVRSVDGLEAAIGSDGEIAAAVNRKTGAHVFSIDGPFAVEPDDFESEEQRGMGATVLYSLIVARADEQDIALATFLAVRLAERLGGWVSDPQVDEARAPQLPVARGLTLEMAWYRLRDGSADFADTYLSAARAHLPVAVPTRFGIFEPLKGKFPRDPDIEFDRIYREKCAVGSLMFDGNGIRRGRITGWTNDLRSRLQVIRIALDFDVLQDSGETGGVFEFFSDVARKSTSFFASSELSADASSLSRPSSFEGGWGGLPPEPKWMTWFSTEYAELVRPYLDPGVVTETPEGVVHRWTDSPAERRVLTPKARRTPWVDVSLLATLDSSGDSEALAPAKVMPPSLRRPDPGSSEAMRIEANIARNRAKEVRE